MDKSLVAARLERLLVEGNALRAEPSLGSRNENIAIWFARALDTLALFLPDGSGLLKMITEIRDRCLKEKYRELPPEALQAVQIASEFNRDRRGDDVLSDLRHDVHTVITEMYRKSWWFYAPIAILGIAAVFAISGVIQLKDTKVNVREEAAAALQRAKESIDLQQRSAETAIAASGARAKEAAEEAKKEVERRLDLELQAYVAEQRQRIKDATDQQIDVLKRERAPNIDSTLGAYQVRIDSLQARLREMDNQFNRMASSSDELQRGLNRIDAAAKGGTLDRLGIFLNRSRRYVAAELTITTIALLASLVLAISIWRKR